MTNSVADLLTAAAQDRPDGVAVVEASGGRRLTWSQLDDETSRVAAGLGAAGLVGGSRVTIALGNRIEFVTTYLGALRARFVAVPVNPRSTAGELARTVAHSGSRMVVGDSDTVAGVREAMTLLVRARDGEVEDTEGIWSPDSALPQVVVVGAPTGDGERTYADLLADPGRPLPPQQDAEVLAALLYTSGTSGRPRGAMLSHRALLANIEQVASVEPPMITADDVVLGVLPLFHVYGLNAVLGGTLRQRARLVLAERFEPSGTLDLIEDEAVSVVPVAPPVFAQWLAIDDLRERLGPVRTVLSGSAPLSAEVIDAFEAATGVPVHQGYGLTEASPVVTSTLCSPHAQAGSVGAALPGIDIRLVDDQGHAPEPGDPGEIEIRGANLFSGYWPDGADGPDGEGWWLTGDVGFLDPDGDLVLVDRRKELVIVSGFNVFPVEVEDVITEVDGVSAAAVIGVADERTGEAVVAYVVADGPEDRVRDAVLAHCATRLARFKQPTTVHVVDELPYTVTGKVQKGRLRAAERRRTVALLEDGQ
ncbi:long-chain fatty acid--CoA ligase [Nocardioides guangzhouensis]|uniref:Long-chain fatty acid--CoA ligase n=1 Tax=Nocardioides guangzhouensis TaxID=2497878 RepID=A0A4Q4ZJ61_9ACTN|nr:class I adenylate-forming enzyme family protein [Nocardioides guangzhouensis]RYP87978.1 long-chain fatty acid--CoA ligase [Nocardioides guangzhouensis]